MLFLFIEEAIWIKEHIFLKLDDFQTVLDIGSSSFYFRSVIQPFIENEIFKPLQAAGKTIYHLDRKPEVGVDLVIDVEKLEKLEEKFDFILCCNVLEHVKNPLMVAKRIQNNINENGFLIVTVPFSYPYHCDPFDNMWRPNPNTLIKVFHNLYPLAAEIIKTNSTPYTFLYRRLLSIFESFYDGNLKKIIKNFNMIFRHSFSVSCVFFSFGLSHEVKC